MPIYKAPVEDVTFLLNDVFQIDRYDNLPGFTDASADVREAISAGDGAAARQGIAADISSAADFILSRGDRVD